MKTLFQSKIQTRYGTQSNQIYAYEISDEDFIANEGWVLEANQQIEDTLSTIADYGRTARDAVAHIFQDSKKGKTTATAAAVGFYAGGLPGAGIAAAGERAQACVNCHAAEPISQALETGINFATSSPDSSQSR